MNETFSKARCKELEELAGRLGIRFKDIGLLHQALTHTSYSNESKIKVEHNSIFKFLMIKDKYYSYDNYLIHEYQLSEEDLKAVREYYR